MESRSIKWFGSYNHNGGLMNVKVVLCAIVFLGGVVYGENARTKVSGRVDKTGVVENTLVRSYLPTTNGKTTVSKALRVNQDTTVLLRIATYLFDKNAWTMNETIDFSYNAQGTMAGWAGFSIPKNRFLLQAGIEYEENGVGAKITTVFDLSESRTYTQVDVTEYYYKKVGMYCNLYQPSELKHVYNIEKDTITPIDYFHICDITTDIASGFKDTMSEQIQEYTHKNDTLDIVCTEYELVNPAKCHLNFMYIYHYNANGVCDSISEIRTPYEELPRKCGSYAFTRENGRIVTQLYIFDDNFRFIKKMTTFTYDPSGRMESYVVESGTRSSDVLVPVSKGEFTYGPLATGVKNVGVPDSWGMVPTMLLQGAKATFSLPLGMKVISVETFDLCGRISERHPSFDIANQGILSVRFSEANGALRLLKLTTNKGVFTYRTIGLAQP